MRSAYEDLAARRLDAWNIRWEYEVHTFLLPNGEQYTPDFWLTEIGVFLEVKGGPHPERLHKPWLLAHMLDPEALTIDWVAANYANDDGDFRRGIPIFIWENIKTLWHAISDHHRDNYNMHDTEYGGHRPPRYGVNGWCNCVAWIRCGYCTRKQPLICSGLWACRHCGKVDHATRALTWLWKEDEYPAWGSVGDWSASAPEDLELARIAVEDGLKVARTRVTPNRLGYVVDFTRLVADAQGSSQDDA